MKPRHAPCTLALALAAMCAGTAPAAERPPVTVPVAVLAAAPVLDGRLGEWGTSGWIDVQVKPAVDPAERRRLGLEGEDRNQTGTITVRLRAGAHGGRLYLALRWPDEAEDRELRSWQWNGARYLDDRRRDDMLAVRFHMDGDYDRSMLSARTYRVDLWLWSAARSDPLGLAEDWVHSISAQPGDDAAEYRLPDKTSVFIRKQRDAGAPLYFTQRAPREHGAGRVAAVRLAEAASGSIADVSAKGAWAAGHWSLELSRALSTGNPDDVAFARGQRVLAQIAVFNRGHDEHKSVSEPLLFDFAALR